MWDKNTYTLNNGVKMPAIGFGFWDIKDERLCYDTVRSGLDAGYRLIDTAIRYNIEKPMGEAITDSGIPREEIFITNKVWSDHYGYENMKKALDESLKAMKTTYFDLVLLYIPSGDVVGSWKALEEYLEMGKIKAIGVSNFNVEELTWFINQVKVKPMLNQIEINPFHQRIDEIPKMKELGVQLNAWSQFAEGKNEIFQNEILKNIADKYHKSIPQVILRWLIDQDIVVIPKSVNPDRQKQNLDVFDFKLEQSDFDEIKKLDLKKSFIWDLTDFEHLKINEMPK